MFGVAIQILHQLDYANAHKDYDPYDTASPSMSDFPETEDHQTFAYRELPRAFREDLDATFQEQLPQKVKSLLVERLSDCLQRVSSRYHSVQQASLRSNLNPEISTMSTPKASSNGFQPLTNAGNQHYSAFTIPGTTAPVSWHQLYEVQNTSCQLQPPLEGQKSQTGSVDLPQSRSRDSGYGANSVCCFPNCSEYCSCYDSSDVNRSSLDGSTQAGNFADALGLPQNLKESLMDSTSMHNDILTSIPRTNGDLDSLDFLQLL